MSGHLGMRVYRADPFSVWFPFRNIALKGKDTGLFSDQVLYSHPVERILLAVTDLNKEGRFYLSCFFWN